MFKSSFGIQIICPLCDYYDCYPLGSVLGFVKHFPCCLSFSAFCKSREQYFNIWRRSSGGGGDCSCGSGCRDRGGGGSYFVSGNIFFYNPWLQRCFRFNHRTLDEKNPFMNKKLSPLRTSFKTNRSEKDKLRLRRMRLSLLLSLLLLLLLLLWWWWWRCWLW